VRLAVLGSPVEHSLSPAMHRAALAASGISGDYSALDVDASGFDAAVALIREGGLDGANVTMPHKARAYSACDTRSVTAVQAWAVNTLMMDDEGLVGNNTDVAGIRAAWEWSGLADDAPVTVLGAGGASAAALVALNGRRIAVAARRRDAAAALVKRTGVPAATLEWGEVLPGSVVVNATPIGMRGESLPEEVLEEAVGLFDMAYGDQPTGSVTESRRRGIPVAEGLDMLVGQAVESFRLWTGVVVDPQIMRGAARAEILRRKRSERG